jgi:hypothetical protein
MRSLLDTKVITCRYFQSSTRIVHATNRAGCQHHPQACDRPFPILISHALINPNSGVKHVYIALTHLLCSTKYILGPRLHLTSPSHPSHLSPCSSLYTCYPTSNTPHTHSPFGPTSRRTISSHRPKRTHDVSTNIATSNTMGRLDRRQVSKLRIRWRYAES